jgi:hypothetical protein
MARELRRFERQICDIQGRLFEYSKQRGLDSSDFIEKFMNSNTCRFMDMPYDRLQWAGEEYIMETLMDEVAVIPAGEQYDTEELFWIGYIYRYWRLFTEENSREIFAQAGAERMKQCYPGFHTLDIVMAIEDLKELNRQSQSA